MILEEDYELMSISWSKVAFQFKKGGNNFNIIFYNDASIQLEDRFQQNLSE